MLVALSGGKDSLVTLDLCCQVFPVVEAYFMYLVPDLLAVEGSAVRAAERWHVPLHKIPHWNLAEYLKKGVYHHRARGLKVRNLKARDVEAYMRNKTGITWIAYGDRQQDSIVRRRYLRECGHVNDVHHRLYPVHDWTTRQVKVYLKARQIPLPTTFGQTTVSAGFDLSSGCMAWLRRKSPSDYAKVQRWFTCLGGMPDE